MIKLHKQDKIGFAQQHDGFETYLKLHMETNKNVIKSLLETPKPNMGGVLK